MYIIFTILTIKPGLFIATVKPIPTSVSDDNPFK
jgi:hypothetical protein